MDDFQQIPEARILTCRDGIYRQCKLFHFRGSLFFPVASGLALVHGEGLTSNDREYWKEIYIPGREVDRRNPAYRP